MGDRVLCVIARRLERCVCDSDLVARMGGDEFTVLMTDIPSQEAVASKVAHLLAVMAEPLGPEFGGVKMPSCSIGVAFFPGDGTDADTLLSHADGDMYRVKRLRFATDGNGSAPLAQLKTNALICRGIGFFGRGQINQK